MHKYSPLLLTASSKTRFCNARGKTGRARKELTLKLICIIPLPPPAQPSHIYTRRIMIRQQRLSSRSSWLVILSLLALLTVPITAQQTPTQCTPNPYQGFCSSIGITSTSLPANVSSQIEAAIQASPLKNKLLSLGILDFECATLLQSFICVEKFPQCVGTGTTAVQQRVCKSSCSAAVQACSAAFQRAGLKDPLPNCDANTDPAFARTAPLADDVQGGAVCVKSERFLANVGMYRSLLSCSETFCFSSYVRRPS